MEDSSLQPQPVQPLKQEDCKPPLLYVQQLQADEPYIPELSTSSEQTELDLSSFPVRLLDWHFMNSIEERIERFYSQFGYI